MLIEFEQGTLPLAKRLSGARQDLERLATRTVFLEMTHVLDLLGADDELVECVRKGTVTIYHSDAPAYVYRLRADPIPTPGDIDPELRAEFDAVGSRSLGAHLNLCFRHTYKPVLDDEPFRAFDTMADYRAWCEANVPWWLGYSRNGP